MNYNFSFDTNDLDKLSEGYDCYIFVGIKNGSVACKVGCKHGSESDMGSLMAIINQDAMVNAVVDAVDELDNADAVFEKYKEKVIQLMYVSTQLEEEETSLVGVPVINPIDVYQQIYQGE